MFHNIAIFLLQLSFHNSYTQAQFKRRFSVASYSTVQMSKNHCLSHLHWIRRDKNATFELGLSRPTLSELAIFLLEYQHLSYIFSHKQNVQNIVGTATKMAIKLPIDDIKLHEHLL